MNNQGFIYAVLQYFTVEDKPRLNRRNTWFRDHFHMSDDTAIRLILSFFILAIAIIIYSMIGGIL